jgi:lysozyme family protein
LRGRNPLLAYTYQQLAPEYQQLWDTMKIVRDAAELNRVATKIQLHKAVYVQVENATGVPWQMIAVIHLREAGELDIGRWQCVLHNGEHIVATGRKTTLVPEGCGPFATWHDAAVHALKQKGFNKIKSWPISRTLWALEPYNGYGYRNKGLRSPYLWASTNHQQRGKYVRDRVFDPTIMDEQVGCAAQLKYLGVGAKIASPTEVAATAAGIGLGTTLLVDGSTVAAGMMFALIIGLIIYKILK